MKDGVGEANAASYPDVWGLTIRNESANYFLCFGINMWPTFIVYENLIDIKTFWVTARLLKLSNNEPVQYLNMYLPKHLAQAEYDTRSIFKWSLADLNSVFLLLDWLPYQSYRTLSVLLFIWIHTFLSICAMWQMKQHGHKMPIICSL